MYTELSGALDGESLAPREPPCPLEVMLLDDGGMLVLSGVSLGNVLRR